MMQSLLHLRSRLAATWMHKKESTTKCVGASAALLDEIHLWTVPLADQVVTESLVEILSREELSRAARFVRESDRARYLASHRALRRILGHYSGERPEQLWFEFNQFGKPKLGNSAGIEFNMSHSGEIALIAVRAGGRVGVDVEAIRNHSANLEVAEKYFSTGELRRLKSAAPGERGPAFFRCWTRKEAYLKAVGCGISDMDLATVEVTLLADEKPAILQGRKGADGPEEWSVFHLEPQAGYVGAVVAEGTTPRLSNRSWPVDLEEG